MSTTAQLNETTREEQLQAHNAVFVWHQIFGASEQASVDFYTKAFGWGTHDFPLGDMGSYKMLTANGIPIAGVIGTEGGACTDMKNVPPHWAVSIAVDNVDARTEGCLGLGGMLLSGPMDIPTVGRVALLQDPQGATFWLFQPE